MCRTSPGAASGSPSSIAAPPYYRLLLSCLDQRAEDFSRCGGLASRKWFSGVTWTVEAVTAAVPDIGAGLRMLNLRGRSPNFERAPADGFLDSVGCPRR